MHAIHQALNPTEDQMDSGSVHGGHMGAVESLHPMVESSITAVGRPVEGMITEAAAKSTGDRRPEGAC